MKILYVIKSLNMERNWEIFLIHACIYLYNELDCPKQTKKTMKYGFLVFIQSFLINNCLQYNLLYHLGWVPVEKTSRQYCWHASAVDLDRSLGLFMG